ncbi:FAD-dependent oxidoreductase [Clostridium bovifaecis]|uniref:FAD-dependent oxidoreductase n=1 Tax=Clostridium bovifaecis TaxID=2184719 RepID=A0A6I6EK56_9CLOT|nr:FAD-dependent oxidoreductase [Clostridium bovifaecis]
MFDVTIIGAGVVGCCTARELAKYNLNICVLEKGSDVAVGTTKANSAIIHAGYDAKPNTLKGKLNAKGNAMFDELVKELDFPFKRNGSLVLCFDEKEMPNLLELKERGEKNGVPDLEIIYKEKILELEPNINENVFAALYAPTGGIVCPYEMTIAFAENAATNGVEFKLDTEVVEINKINDKFLIKTSKGEIESKVVINAAGLFSDDINNMVSKNKIKIMPRRGEYCLFDKTVGIMAKMTLFQLPTKLGKGILVTPTVDGNLLIGPNADDIEDKCDLSNTREGLDDIVDKARITFKDIPMRYLIKSFAGNRARGNKDDFIIGEADDVKGFINAAGIESPGLSSSPAIAEMIGNIVVEKLSPSKNENFNPIRKGIPRFRDMSEEERVKAIKGNPSYGKVVCRCETVTEAEILEAIRRPLGARNLDAVKRRTRAGMGRCQSGFCSNKVLNILAEELKIDKKDVTLFGGNSNILVGKNKEI